MPPAPTPTSAHPCIRPQRADALRNRDRVLDAARAAFAEDGLDAQMPEIARRAGVGVGTVYRHFPTKHAVLAAIATAHFERLAAMADEALARDCDAWQSLQELLWASARMIGEDRGLADIAATEPDAMNAAAVARADLLATMEKLIERAKLTGMRADATIDDIPTIMCGLGRVAGNEARGASMSWERYLTLMLDGLRAR